MKRIYSVIERYSVIDIWTPLSPPPFEPHFLEPRFLHLPPPATLSLIYMCIYICFCTTLIISNVLSLSPQHLPVHLGRDAVASLDPLLSISHDCPSTTYTCRYIYTHIHMYTHTHTHTHAYVFILYLHTLLVYVFVCAREFKCGCSCVCEYVYIHTHTNVYIHTYTRVHTYTHTCYTGLYSPRPLDSDALELICTHIHIYTCIYIYI